MGSVSINSDQTITYAPAVNFVNGDAFRYFISDGHGETGVANVVVGHSCISAVGTYSGIVYPNAQASTSASGWIRITVTKTGRFSASLIYGGTSYPLLGVFAPDGSFQRLIVRPGNQSVLAVTLQLHQMDSLVSCRIGDGQYTASNHAHLLTYNAKTAPAPQAGLYTALLPANPAKMGVEFPKGCGYWRIKVSAGGTIAATGKLGDGTAFSTTGLLVSGNTFPIYLRIYGAPPYRGNLFGEIIFLDASAVDDCTGVLRWFKPPQKSGAFYRVGFDTTTTLIGSLYKTFASGIPMLAFPDRPSNGYIEVGVTDPLAQWSKNITLWRNNQITVDAPSVDRLAVKLNKANGGFSGSFYEPVTLKRRTFTGVVVQKQMRASGIFIGTGETGYVNMVPK